MTIADVASMNCLCHVDYNTICRERDTAASLLQEVIDTLQLTAIVGIKIKKFQRILEVIAESVEAATAIVWLRETFQLHTTKVQCH